MEHIMNRRSFLKAAGIGAAGFFLTGCLGLPKNNLSLYERSMIVRDDASLKKAYDKAKLFVPDDPAFSNLRIVRLKGEPYEMGLQHGKLLKEQIHESYSRVMRYARLISKDQMLDEAFDLVAPYIPTEYYEEMRGIAHGADLNIRAVHWFHAIPEVAEHMHRKRFLRDAFKGFSCSNIAAFGSATDDGKLYAVRILDWIMELGVQKCPAIIIYEPTEGYASVNFSWAGFVGSVTGMNEARMTFGEMSHGDKYDEDLQGMPFPMLFRKLMNQADSLESATRMIEGSRRTNAYAYVIGDGKARDALLYDVTRDKVVTYGHNTELVDDKVNKRFPALEHMVYAGRYEDRLYEQLSGNHGDICPESLIGIIKEVAMKSNLHDVIMSPETMEAWIANAAGMDNRPDSRAYNQRFFHLELDRYL